MEDMHIIRLFFDRAEGAVDALAKKYGAMLRRICTNILASPEDAAECVNDTYLAVWNAIPPASPDPLSTYVYKVCRNTALKRLRTNGAQKRSAYRVSLEELSECIPDHSLSEALEARELGRAIDRFLDTLSKENRVIFLRRYWFGDSLGDISQLTGLRTNALTVRLSRMRTALRAYLNKEGYLNEGQAGGGPAADR